MIHLNRDQYAALKAFSMIVRKELMNRQLNREVSSTIFMLGQEYGFCNDEIYQIIENCYEDLVEIVVK